MTMITTMDHHDHYEDLDSSQWSVDFSEAQPLLLASEKRGREKKIKQKIWSNVSALVVAMGIFSTGLNPIDDLQGTLNSAGGLGIKYGSMILASLLTSTLLIHKLGSKRAMVVGAVFYCLYVVANFYPIWASLVPLTVAAGLGGALMWTAVSSYLARMGVCFAELTGDPEARIQILFFSALNTASYISAALGGLASFFILGTGFSLVDDFPVNSIAICGPDYCNEEVFEDDGNPTLNHGLDSAAIYGLCGFCLAVTMFAVVMMGVFVYPVSSLGIVEHMGKDEDEPPSTCRLLLATVRLWKSPKLLLLVPLTLVYGCQDAFWRVEFSRGYVTCALGIHYIGFLMIFYNIAALISSFLCGWLGTQIRRSVAVTFLVLADMATVLFALYWHPSSKDLYIALMVTGVSGITYGGLSTLLLAFYGVAHPDNLEAAYSNLYFWSLLGSTVMYAFSFYLCLKLKLLIILSLLMLGCITYIWAEAVLASEEKKKMIMRAKAHGQMISKRMLVPAGF